MCLCVRVSVISITQKQIVAKTSNLAFFLHLYHELMALGTFCEDQTSKQCAETQKRILKHYSSCMEFFVGAI